MSARVADLWTVQVTMRTRHGWHTAIANLAFPLTRAVSIDRLAADIAERDGVEVLEVLSITYLSWPGVAAHYRAAPEASAERVEMLRERGYGGPA